jgi:hypothetical protein
MENQEFYELRIYRIFDFDKQLAAEAFVKEALLPALVRQQIDRVGVFRNQSDPNDHSVFMLIPYKTMDAFVNCEVKLGADKEYQTAAANYFDRELSDPVFHRIENHFMEAFAGMPVIEPSKHQETPERIYELRLYESPTEDHARRKVKMFNDGEIDIMRNTGLGPVFFGRTLAGHRCPNLIYMLSAENEAAHKEHWKAFLADPEWVRIKVLPEYKDTVSKIDNWMLKPTGFSQL